VSEAAQVTIGYSSLAERVANIQFPKLSIPHSILISIQNPKSIDYEIPDSNSPVKVVESSQVGVAKSRNLAIDNTETEYLVFADDDATVSETGLLTSLDYLDKHPNCDLVLAMTVDELGNVRKRYPKKQVRLHLFNSAKAGTIEMLVRVDSIKRLGIHFDERFGAGSSNKVGDEYIFISDLIKAGGHGVFLPVVLASHAASSSGHLVGTDENLMARARVFHRVFGRFSPVIRAGYYIRRGLKNFRVSEFLRFVRG
jgi:hypothetical protein